MINTDEEIRSREDSLAKLVELARAGNNEAFGFLYSHYSPQISRYLMRRVGNDEDVYDLAQEVFSKAWQRLPDLEEGRRFRAWLYTIAANVSIDYLRDKKRESPFWEYITGNYLEEDRADTQEFEAGVEEREMVRLALEQISPRLRTCLLMRIEGFSVDEIARLLQMQAGSVAAYISLARKQLRQVYDQLTNEREPDRPATFLRHHESPSYSEQGSHAEIASQLNQSGSATRFDDSRDKETRHGATKQQDVEGELDGQSTTEGVRTETQTELAVYIKKLPEIYRQTLYLKLVEHRSNRQIAAHLQRPLGTVKSHISRGKQMLHAIMQQDGTEGELHEQFVIEGGGAETPAELAVCINRLPETYRKTLHLKLIEHHSDRQIAAELRLRLGTVKSHISRGKKLLFG